MSAARARREVPFNKAVLKWARERRGRSYEQAANSAGVTPEKIIEWEEPEVDFASYCSPSTASSKRGQLTVP